jgi:hypothetical protein
MPACTLSPAEAGLRGLTGQLAVDEVPGFRQDLHHPAGGRAGYLRVAEAALHLRDRRGERRRDTVLGGDLLNERRRDNLVRRLGRRVRHTGRAGGRRPPGAGRQRETRPREQRRGGEPIHGRKLLGADPPAGGDRRQRLARPHRVRARRGGCRRLPPTGGPAAASSSEGIQIVWPRITFAVPGRPSAAASARLVRLLAAAIDQSVSPGPTVWATWAAAGGSRDCPQGRHGARQSSRRCGIRRPMTAPFAQSAGRAEI